MSDNANIGKRIDKLDNLIGSYREIICENPYNRH